MWHINFYYYIGFGNIIFDKIALNCVLYWVKSTIVLKIDFLTKF